MVCFVYRLASYLSHWWDDPVDFLYKYSLVVSGRQEVV